MHNRTLHEAWVDAVLYKAAIESAADRTADAIGHLVAASEHHPSNEVLRSALCHYLELQERHVTGDDDQPAVHEAEIIRFDSARREGASINAAELNMTSASENAGSWTPPSSSEGGYTTVFAFRDNGITQRIDLREPEVVLAAACLAPSERSETPPVEPVARGHTANLTQELAKLLAAAIAQGQTGQRRAGTPTGAELASLAALVSASQNQREGVQLTEHHHDDEPMPIPSTWRQPAVNNDDRWYRQQMSGAVLGLVAGLMVMVPAVLWLSGWLGGPQVRASLAHRQPAVEQKAPAAQTAYFRPVRVQIHPIERSDASWALVRASKDATEPLFVVKPFPSEASDTIPTVRRDLVLAARMNRAATALALGRTYDPSFLLRQGGIAWQHADVLKARTYYRTALALGDMRALPRLAALQ